MAAANQACAIHGREAVGPVEHEQVPTGLPFTTFDYYHFACREESP
jgi:hypothetical protein